MRLAIAALPLCACAAVLGIDDGHSRADGGGQADGAPPVTDDGSAEGGDQDVEVPTTLPDGAPLPNGCEHVTLDATKGIFVAKTGTDTPSCGSMTAPCATVQNGVNRAHDSSSATPNVYVAEGTYVEALALKSGVSVIGGWVASTTGPWAYPCSNQGTIIAAPAGQGTTVTASGFPAGSPSKLSTLSIVSSDPAPQPGESLFGVVATGASTALSLVWVNVTAFPGSNGAPGAVGESGPTSTGPCSSPGDAGVGTTPGTKGPGADAGTFVASGYVVGTGQPGTSGASGANGERGGDAGCVPCFSCSGLVCSETSAGNNCGTAGQPGCGGGGGLGGTGGGSGGSSVAVLAIDAHMVLASCVLTASNAGNGGPGGPGGGGGTGSSGAAGAAGPANPLCAVSCGGLGVGACSVTNGVGTGGSAGGTGGSGAAGGPGGDGAGGDSFAVVELGNAAISDEDASTVYSYGAAGAGGPDGGNGAVGNAGQQGP